MIQSSDERHQRIIDLISEDILFVSARLASNERMLGSDPDKADDVIEDCRMTRRELRRIRNELEDIFTGATNG